MVKWGSWQTCILPESLWVGMGWWDWTLFLFVTAEMWSFFFFSIIFQRYELAFQGNISTSFSPPAGTKYYIIRKGYAPPD